MSQKMSFDPRFSISLSMASSLASIERSRGFLEGAQLSEEWISKMQERALLLEAYHTTHIEGSQLTLSESEKLLEGETLFRVDQEDVRELLNYRRAFDFVSEYLSSQGEITEGLIREIHHRLVENVRGNSAQPGQYRVIQNYVANSKTKEIIYTPPPAYEVPILMKELVEWMQKQKNIPKILVAGITQFQLVHIHPFLDGNGRCARLLSTLVLYKSGYDFKRLFTISEFYDRSRQEYYQAIQSVRDNQMDMTLWLEYFCKGLETQMVELQCKGQKAIQLDLMEMEHILTPRQKRILDHLYQEPKEFSIQEVEQWCPGVNRRALQRDLQELNKKGLIGQRGLKKASRYHSIS